MYSKLGKKITNEQFDIKIKDSSFNRISEYINSKTVILFECKTCGKIFKKKPKEFNLLKCGCLKRFEQYHKILNSKNIILIGTYYNVRRKLEHKCLICNNIFISSPKIIKNSKHGCPYCAGMKISTNDYKKRLPSDIIVLDEYINSYTKITHQCLVCKNMWSTKPNYILHMGCGCPVCSCSKGERAIFNLLKSLNIEFYTEKFITINGIKYFYDFYIPSLNLVIEFDGIQHFEPIGYFGGLKQFIIIQKNDNIKNKHILENNINVLRIPYYEIDNIVEIILEKLTKLNLIYNRN